MIKHKELITETSCLNQAADNEPIFVLRANDEIAPAIVEMWAKLYALMKGKNMTDRQRAKHDEALQLAQQMRDWKRR